MDTSRRTGTIKRIFAEKGFGFIKDRETLVDHFFAYSEVLGDRDFKDLREGETVTFDVVPSQKGPRAANVQPEDGRPAPGMPMRPAYPKRTKSGRVVEEED